MSITNPYRPIMFRAWHEGRKEWLHDGKPPSGGCNILGEVIWAFGEWCRVPLEELNDVWVEQFTGLKDSKGIDIYEGDIVTTAPSGSCLTSLLSPDEFVTYTHGRVEWFCGAWKIAQSHLGATPLYDFVDCDCCPTGSVTVIGNIHEYSHLLNPT